GTARQLDLLARDRDLLHELRTNALETARGWPSWDQAGRLMAEALATIRAEPAPDPYAHTQRLLQDVQTGLAAMRTEFHYVRILEGKARKLEAIKRLPGVRLAARLRRTLAGHALLRLLRSRPRRG
ncbi:MAG: hypothetical protein M3P44_08165, partial [Actinomycetota bacterium]|nr:hypothetical protein [Actinomycetota bacterium]